MAVQNYTFMSEVDLVSFRSASMHALPHPWIPGWRHVLRWQLEEAACFVIPGHLLIVSFMSLGSL